MYVEEDKKLANVPMNLFSGAPAILQLCLCHFCDMNGSLVLHSHKPQHAKGSGQSCSGQSLLRPSYSVSFLSKAVSSSRTTCLSDSDSRTESCQGCGCNVTRELQFPLEV